MLRAVRGDNAIRAFTAEKVLRLTGISKRQLQYWDERDFVRPSLTSREGRGRRRLYDFRDLVSLRVAADLRRNGISLQEIRKLDRHLRNLKPAQSLAEVSVWLWEGRVYFSEAETIRAGRQPGQLLISATVPMPAIVKALTSPPLISGESARPNDDGVLWGGNCSSPAPVSRWFPCSGSTTTGPTRQRSLSSTLT